MHKKLLSLLMIVVLSISMLLSVSAEGEQNGVITDDGKTGSITIHKYSVGEMDKLDKYANGHELSDDTVIYQDGEGRDVTLAELGGVEGIPFLIEPVELKVGAAEGSTKPEDYGLKNGENGTERTTNEHGVIELKNLPLGLYKITELENDISTTIVKPFIVSIPMTDPVDGANLLYNIHVYPKNELADAPGIEKYVTYEGNRHDTLYYEGEATWLIISEIPLKIKNAKVYRVIDTRDKILSYNTEYRVEVVAKGTDENGLEKSVKLDIGTDFTFEDLITDPNLNTETSKVSLTPNGIDKIASTFETTFEAIDNGNTTLELPKLYSTFKTTLNIPYDILEDYLGQPIENDALLEFVNSNDAHYETEIDKKPEIHIGGLQIIKIDGSDNNITLSGAKFKIYESEANALADQDAIQVPVGEDENGNMIFSDEITTDENGIARFYGLEYGIKADESNDINGSDYSTGERTYWIVETQAPQDEEGNYYNLLAKPKEVTVTSDTHIVGIKVENNKGFTLPITGGSGTLLFTFGGIVLIGIAITIFAISKKRKAH